MSHVCACAHLVCLHHLSLNLQPSFQVLPYVLPVCEPGLCPSDPPEDTQLEASLLILPLVLPKTHSLTLSLAPPPLTSALLCSSVQELVLSGDDFLPGAHVHILLVLRNRCHGDCRDDLQVHWVSRVCCHGDVLPPHDCACTDWCVNMSVSC